MNIRDAVNMVRDSGYCGSALPALQQFVAQAEADGKLLDDACAKVGTDRAGLLDAIGGLIAKVEFAPPPTTTTAAPPTTTTAHQG